MTGYSSRLLYYHDPCFSAFTATLVDLVGLKNSRGVEKGGYAEVNKIGYTYDNSYYQNYHYY